MKNLTTLGLIAPCWLYPSINQKQKIIKQLLISSFIVLLYILSSNALYAQNKYYGVWKSGNGGSTITKFNKWSDFIADGNERAQNGLRCIDFEYFTKGGKRHYVGVWKSGSGSNIIAKFNKWSDFIADGDERVQDGLRLVDFEYFTAGNKRHYVGIWKSGSGSNIITKFNKWSNFIADGNQKAQNGLRLVDFEYYTAANKRHYVGVWRSGAGGKIIAKFNKWSDFMADGINKTHNEGLRLIDFERYKTGEKNHYVGVWKKGSSSTNIIVKFNKYADFIADGNDKAKNQGLRLVDFEAYTKTSPIRTSPGGGSTVPISEPEPSCASLPRVPDYIDLSDDDRLVIDFTTIVGEPGKPRITIPEGYLPLLPVCDGEYVWPTNYCGMRITKAARFLWLDKDDKTIGTIGSEDDFYYQSIPESSSIQEHDFHAYSNGIEFSGPIGDCSTSNNEWGFSFSITKNGILDPNNPTVKLVIDMVADSGIEFINHQAHHDHQVHPEAALDPLELFKKKEYKDLAYLAETIEFFEIRNFIENANN